MNDNSKDKSLIVVTDLSGKITDVIQNNLIEIDEGHYFPYIFGPSSTPICLEFIGRLTHIDSAECRYINYLDDLLLLNGYKNNDTLLLTVIVIDQEKLIHELTHKESDQVGKPKNETHDEITRLNQKLVDMQRKFTKMTHELQSKNDELSRVAIHDSLTGLYNRLYLQSKFSEICALQRRLKHAVTIVMIDLNDFKLVNDSYGHDEGDRLLVKFAEVGQNITRKDFDYFFRIGGDEFLIIMIECSQEKAIEVCKRIDETFRKFTVVSSISYGVVSLDVEESQRLEYYLSESDKKMYAYKKSYKLRNHSKGAN